MKSKNKERLSAGFLVSTIILSFIAVILALFLISLLLESHKNVMHDEDLFYYNFGKSRYFETYNYYLRNSALEEPSKEFSELYAAANYWHNSLMYYGLKGSEKANQFENAMQKNRENAGSLDFLLKDMDKLFENYK